MRQPIRYIIVTAVSRITPHMARVTFGGADLADFVLDGPDRQVKLYFPHPGQAVPVLPDPDLDFMSWYGAFAAMPDAERPWMRSYTVRGFDAAAEALDIDFVLHDGHVLSDRDGGPATRWAMEAAHGDTLAMYGPSADYARPVPLSASIGAGDWLLLAGDETALPAIGTIVESLAPGVRAEAWIEVAGAADEQRFATTADLTVHWVHRDGGAHGRFVDAVRAVAFPPGTPFAWIAGEAGAVRALRRHLVDERGIPKRAIDFTGNWRLRLAQDDQPTEADLADANELLTHARELVENQV